MIRYRAAKKAIFVLILGFSFWTIGAGLPQTQIQNTETPSADVTTTATFLVTATATSEPEPGGRTPTETGVAGISSTPTQETAVRPLPAYFAAGAFLPGKLIVRYKASTSATRIEECFRDIDVQIQSQIEEINTLVLSLVSGDMGNTYYHIMECAGVLYVEPNFLLQAADTIPNDPGWGIQYGLVNIRAPQGWDLSTGSPAVTIAVVDSGVDYSHPDLAGKLVAGYDFVNNDADPQDDHGHGTHVAGIIAAASNNGIGIAGVSWGARIMPVKVLNFKGGGTYADTAAGVIWAADHGAQIINLSLGGTGPSSVLADAINYVHNKNVVVVAAAGNTGSNFVLYPARYPNVIAVANTNSGNHWSGSNYGPEIDISAPGASIYSTTLGGGYDYKSGSSMSAGFVSGLAAILKGVLGDVSPDLIEFQIESTALDVEFTGWDVYTGAGLIQMDTAIQLALPPQKEPKEQNPASPGGGFNPGQIIASITPTPGWTASPTLPAPETIASNTPKPEPVGQMTETATNTSAPEKNEVEAQSNANKNEYLLPILGSLLILAGLVLLWMRRKR